MTINYRVTSVHPNANVAERRHRLIELKVDRRSNLTQNQHSNSVITLTLSSEGSAKLMEAINTVAASFQESTPLFHVQTTLAHLAREELSKGTIVLEGSYFFIAELYVLLQDSYCTTSTLPVPTSLSQSQCGEVFAKLSTFALFKASTSSLSSELQALKAELVSMTVQHEREKQKRIPAAMRALKLQINELLRASGESDFPFEELKEDQEISNPENRIIRVALDGDLATLSDRNSSVWKQLEDLVEAYIEQGVMLGNPFKNVP